MNFEQSEPLEDSKTRNTALKELSSAEKLRLEEERKAAALKLAEDSKYKLFSSNGSEDQDTVKDKLEIND